MIRKISYGAIICGLAWFLWRGNSERDVVAFLQTIEHPALNETRKGFEEAMRKKFPNKTYVFESVQGNPTLAAQLAKKYANASIIVTAGTLPSQMAMNATKKTPIVFISVTDPTLLIKNLKRPEGNITGVSNYVDIKKQLSYFKTLQPGLKKIGVIFNPGEANSVKDMEWLKPIAQEMNLVVVEKTACKVSEVSVAAQSLAAQNIDAFYIMSDNAALSAYTAIVRAAGKIPVYVTDVDCLKQGGTAALGANQYALGKQAADMAERILNKKPLSSIPVEWPKEVIKQKNP